MNEGNTPETAIQTELAEWLAATGNPGDRAVLLAVQAWLTEGQCDALRRRAEILIAARAAVSVPERATAEHRAMLWLADNLPPGESGAGKEIAAQGACGRREFQHGAKRRND